MFEVKIIREEDNTPSKTDIDLSNECPPFVSNSDRFIKEYAERVDELALDKMNKDKQTGFKISKESVEKLFPKNDIDILGYQSPVQVIMGQMRMEQENNIVKAIQDYGVDVDKDELIKALQYDRDQYEKGYINGYNRKASDVAREIFEEIEKKVLFSTNTGVIALLAYNELKKKYTESEKDDG